MIGDRTRLPRKGFATIYFDSCVFDTDSLEYLARKTGAARVMLGSDAPFPIGNPEPVKVIRNADFTGAQKGGMLGETAQQVFRIRSDSQTGSRT